MGASRAVGAATACVGRTLPVAGRRACARREWIADRVRVAAVASCRIAHARQDRHRQRSRPRGSVRVVAAAARRRRPAAPLPLTLADAIQLDARAEQRRRRRAAGHGCRAAGHPRRRGRLRSAARCRRSRTSKPRRRARRRSAARSTAASSRISSPAALGLDGRTPWAGGRFTVDFTSSRLESSNQFARLNPQFPVVARCELHAAAVARPDDRRRAPADPAGAPRRGSDRPQLDAGADGPADAGRAGLLGSGVRGPQPRGADHRAGAGAVRRSRATSGRRSEGTLAPIDVVEAQTRSSNFRQNVASAQQALTEAENRLKSLMLPSRDGAAVEPADRAGRARRSPGAVDVARRGRAAGARPPSRAGGARRRPARRTRSIGSSSAIRRSRSSIWSAPTRSRDSPAARLQSSTPIRSAAAGCGAPRAAQRAVRLRAGLAPLDAPTAERVDGSAVSRRRLRIVARQPGFAPLSDRHRAAADGTADPQQHRPREPGAHADHRATQIARQRQQLEQTIEAEVRNTLQAVQSSQQRLDAAAPRGATRASSTRASAAGSIRG